MKSYPQSWADCRTPATSQRLRARSRITSCLVAVRRTARFCEPPLNLELISPMLMLAILALGIAARCRQYVGCPSYWYDEAYLLLNIFEKSYTDLLGALQYNVVIPPLVLWMLRGLYLVAGSSEWVMRLPAAVACLAGLFLMIPLARRVVGPGIGVCAVSLCALLDHHLMHGCEVRPYSIDFL